MIAFISSRDRTAGRFRSLFIAGTVSSSQTIIAVVTFILCMAGLRIGKKFGTQLSGKANILGGVILIGIGLEIFITGVF